MGWLSFILSQSNHCKNAVRDWANKKLDVLGALFESKIRDVEFSDDRLANLLDTLSDDNAWNSFEEDLSKSTIAVYDLPVEVVRLDGSAACGYHTVTENGIMQYGNSKDHRPDLPQLKMMLATLDPGLPLGIEVLSGENNDDRLYTPLIQKVRPMINKTGILFIGDCKMSSLETRYEIEDKKDYYLAPLALGKGIKSYFNKLVDHIVDGTQEAVLLYKECEDGSQKLIGAGYEVVRKQKYEKVVKNPPIPSGLDQMMSQSVEEVPLQTGEGPPNEPAFDQDLPPKNTSTKHKKKKKKKEKEKAVEWDERVFVYRSISFANYEISRLEKKLEKIELELLKLTPDPIKGSRQHYQESKLQEAVENLLKKHGVTDLLNVTLKTELYKNKQRYVVNVSRNEEAIDNKKHRCGWRPLVTNALKERLSFGAAIITYRDEWTLERCFRIMKRSHLGISALYLRKDNRLKAITRLLSMCVRVISLLEYNICKNLKEKNETIKGLDLAHPNKETKTPTAQSIFKKFCREQIMLSRILVNGKTYWRMTPIGETLKSVLVNLKIPLEIYDVVFYMNRLNC